MGILENQEAQFMLLAGFIIAIGLVITTVMLNSIIFEGNMAIEAGIEPSKSEIINLMQITVDEIRSVYRNTTATGQNETLKFDNFTNQMQRFSANLSKIYALHGGGMNMSWDIKNWKNTQYANFTENGMVGGTANWTVVEGVDVNSVGVFNFSINLSGSGFKILARNSTDTVWSIEFNNTNYNITNTTSTSYGSFSSGSEVDLSSAQYYFKVSTSPGPVSIRIINGNNAFGRFKIQGMANGKNFTRARDYILNATVAFSTGRIQANITVPASVPW